MPTRRELPTIGEVPPRGNFVKQIQNVVGGQQLNGQSFVKQIQNVVGGQQLNGENFVKQIQSFVESFNTDEDNSNKK